MRSNILVKFAAIGLVAAAVGVVSATPASALTNCTVANTVCLFEDTAYNQNKITVGANNNDFGAYNNWASSIKNNRGAGTRFWSGTYQTGANVSVGANSVNANLGLSGMNDLIKSSYTL
jgi:hypothetical protein